MPEEILFSHPPSSSIQYQFHNRHAWDERVQRRDWYIDTATDADFQHPLAIVDPEGWLQGTVHGKRVLCLAAGGGRHSVLFAAAGAHVTVVDLSPKMLELDRKVALERGLKVEIIETSMENLSMFPPALFDVVIQPVSSCYIPHLLPVYQAVARVTSNRGIYISQHKQPVSLQTDTVPTPRGYTLSEPYYRSSPLPEAPPGSWHRESGTFEFLHRWEDLLGGLCRSGFVIENVAEPRHGDPAAHPGAFAHRSLFAPPYIRLKARRLDSSPHPTPSSLIVPG